MKQWIVFFMLCAVIPASATIRYVSKDGTGDFTSGQAAVNASAAGDTIVMRGDQGAYSSEVLTVDRRLVILGQGSGCNNVLATQWTWPVQFTDAGDNSVIAGFVLTGGSVVSLQSGATGIAIRRCYLSSPAGGYVCLDLQGNTSLQVEESILQAGSNSSKLVYAGGPGNNTVNLSNCILSGLDAATSRGFENMIATNNVTMTNCVVVGINAVVFGSGGANWFIDHTIFWSTTWDGNLNAATANNSYNAITAGMTSFTGTNNITINSNPFVSWTAPHDVCTDDVHLTQASGLIDAGNPNAALDRDGSVRDLGVYGGPLNYEVSGAVDYPFVTFYTATPNVPQGGLLELRSTGRVGRGQ